MACAGGWFEYRVGEIIPKTVEYPRVDFEKTSDVQILRDKDILVGILKISSKAIIVADDAGRILMFSAGAEAIFGYRAEEILGRSIARLIPPRFRVAHTRHVAQFAGGPGDSRVMGDRSPISALRKSGEEFPVEASLSKLQTADGLIFTTIVRDITERRRAEEAVARSERRLTVALENASLHVFEMDYRARTLLKTGAEDTFFDRAVTFDDLRQDIWFGVRPDYRSQAESAWRRHMETGAGFRIETPMNRADGREVWGLLTAELIEDENGRPLRLIGALQDITNRRRAEAAIVEAAAAADAANIAKSAFLATMSHEIRTPLNGILGMAQAMANDELSPAQEERLDVVRQSGEALLAILNDVLDLSKIEAGKLDLEAIHFDLGELVRGVQAAFASLATKKGLSLVFDIGPAEGVYLGDPTRVRQILYNLISNALKFTETGEVRVSAARQDGAVRLAVADTGIGMTPEALSHLFSAFVQADKTTTRRFGGTGLGLAISRELAELMGGSIQAKSAPGRGATFEVLLPLRRTDAQIVDSARREGAVVISPDLERIRLLAAEDNPTNQLVLKTLLDQVGIQPMFVANGLQAVAAWEAGDFDVILMDVQMPELDGPGATEIIRRKEVGSGRRRTPIIGLTANAMSHQVEQYLAVGMDGVVTKPIDITKLFEALAAVV